MKHSLRVIFAGTPDFAAIALSAIDIAGFSIPLVLTQPDRPANRGMKLKSSAVKEYALSRSFPIEQPTSLNVEGKFALEAEKAIKKLHNTPHDVIVVAAYGLLLPQIVLDIPSKGCLNIHASLLPRWRGAAPIQRAIEAGDTHTGISIMKMEAGLDTGPIAQAVALPIIATDNGNTLHSKLAKLGATLIVDSLLQLEQQKFLNHMAQPLKGITYAEKINKKETQINWDQNAMTLERKIKAFDPFPGTVTFLNNASLKLWSAKAVLLNGNRQTPGTVISVDSEGILVSCGENALLITEAQKPGGKRLSIKLLIQGYPIHPGQIFI